MKEYKPSRRRCPTAFRYVAKEKPHWQQTLRPCAVMQRYSTAQAVRAAERAESSSIKSCKVPVSYCGQGSPPCHNDRPAGRPNQTCRERSPSMCCHYATAYNAGQLIVELSFRLTSKRRASLTLLTQSGPAFQTFL